MEPTEEAIQKLIREYEVYAKKNGFALNPKRKLVEGIVRALLKKEAMLGCRYCPCRVVTGDKEQDEKIICPCVFHEDEIKLQGFCHCRLFVK
ncbi:hypothetical protein KAT92_00225 [Candidatus Babeliales bacterium]|nr:hypothetical protein [Candidatus Babeliales bacterium]